MITDQDQYRVSPIEMSILIISMIIGVGILTVPRALTSAQETADGWISIGITGIVVMINVFIYVQLQKNFPGKNLLQYFAEGKKGKWLAKILSVSFILYFLFLLGYEARVLGVVVKLYLLDQTPSEVIVLIMLLLIVYAVNKGAQGVIHLSLMFIPIVIFVSFLIFPFNIMNISFERVLPIMPEGILPVLLGVKEMILSYLGVEIIFFFMAYMKVENLRSRPLNLAILFITMLYASVYFFTVAVFGVEMTKYTTFPTVDLAKEVEIPGGFIERIESLVITVWIMTIFNTMSIAFFLLVQTAKQQFLVKKKATYLPAAVAFVVFILAFVPLSLSETFEFGDYIGWFGLSLYITSIISGFLTVWLRKRRAQSNQEVRGM
ncbi:GerAB/ArcD/ProY family transporter [Anaerobacillus sp. MEB173]|uniref:GerAB/ArcD/ProY family transporter n=1 Tax=Anaerobacillus sp. MEB173 TaxID=3383345 RepID=UPI003F8E21BA